MVHNPQGVTTDQHRRRQATGGPLGPRALPGPDAPPLLSLGATYSNYQVQLQELNLRGGAGRT